MPLELTVAYYSTNSPVRACSAKSKGAPNNCQVETKIVMKWKALHKHMSVATSRILLRILFLLRQLKCLTFTGGNTQKSSIVVLSAIPEYVL